MGRGTKPDRGQTRTAPSSGEAVGRAGRLGLVVGPTDGPDESADLLAEEEGHCDDRRDRGLDDEAARSGIDVSDEFHACGTCGAAGSGIAASVVVAIG